MKNMSLDLRIEALTLAQIGQWDAFVAGHPWGTVFHLSRWKDAVEAGFNHIQGRFLVLRDKNSGEIRAGLPVYTVKSWLLGNRIVCAPFADSCDPLVESAEHMEALVGFLVEYSRRISARFIELKLKNAGSLMSGFPFVQANHFKHHRLVLSGTPEQLWPRLSRTAVRRMINKAKMRGIRIVNSRNSHDLQTFSELSGMSRQQLGLPPIPTRFFQAIWNSFDPAQASLLMAYDQEKPAGAILVLHHAGTFHLEYAGERIDYRNTGVGQLLYWEAIRLACAMNCREFSFGRSSPQNQGLMDYKGHWGTRISDLPTMVYPTPSAKMHGSSAGSFAQALFKKLIATVPNPCARLIGLLVYRHWG